MSLGTFHKHPEECGEVEVAQEDQGHAPRELNLESNKTKNNILKLKVIQINKSCYIFL